MKRGLHAKTRHAMCGIGTWHAGAMKAFVALAVFALSFAVWAKTYTQSAMTNGRKWWYYLDSSGNAVIEHENSDSTATAAISTAASGHVDIPSSLDGHAVVGIGSKAFYACAGMTSVTIPNGVKSIDFAAFYNCTSLETVDLPNSLEEILSYAFGYCIKLESITIPGNVTIISNRAFTNCWGLESVTIPNSVATIGKYAFENCTSLEEVVIPGSVTSLGDGAFQGCESLDEVKLPSSLTAADVKSRCFSDCSEDLEITSVATVDGRTWNFRVVDGGAEPCYDGDADAPTIPVSTSGNLVIPATLGGLPVVSIGDSAFSGCNKLKSVTIPATVTSIGEWAFEDCRSMTLTVPDTVTRIGDAAFQGCDAMADANGFVIVRGVLHHYADKSDEAAVPDGVTRIGTYAFFSCGLERVTIPSSVTSIGEAAFRRCEHLEGIDIPPSVTSIGSGAFWGCESMADGDGFVIVRNVLYYYAGDAATVTIPGGVVEIDVMAFYDNDAVRKVVIPASTSGIGFDAFGECDDLREVTIPKGVTRIDYQAFAYYDGIKWVVPLKKVHVEAGDTGRVRNLLINSGHDVAGITFVEDVPAPCVVTFNANGGSVSPATRRVTKGAALGILPEPVRAGFIFDGWFTAAEGGAEVSSGTIVTADSTYYAHWTEVIADILAPGTPGAASVCYTFLDAGAITAPYAPGKTLYGALYDGCNVGGVVELKLGKVNVRKGTSRVSGSVTLLDGKRYMIKGLMAAVDAAAPLSVSLEVNKVGTMSITIGGDQFAGTLGKWHVQTAKVGGNWYSAPTVSVVAGDLSVIPGTVLDDLLPNAEKGVSSGTRWTFAKATSVKWAKPKVGETPVMLDDATGKGLIVDTSKDRTNLSAMRLTYTAKKGTFKGSFKVYALEGSGADTKLKKYSFKVSGVVVNGVGYGSATCKKPVLSWSVTVE